MNHTLFRSLILLMLTWSVSLLCACSTTTGTEFARQATDDFDPKVLQFLPYTDTRPPAFLGFDSIDLRTTAADDAAGIRYRLWVDKLSGDGYVLRATPDPRHFRWFGPIKRGQLNTLNRASVR